MKRCPPNRDMRDDGAGAVHGDCDHSDHSHDGVLADRQIDEPSSVSKTLRSRPESPSDPITPRHSAMCGVAK